MVCLGIATSSSEPSFVVGRYCRNHNNHEERYLGFRSHRRRAVDDSTGRTSVLASVRPTVRGCQGRTPSATTARVRSGRSVRRDDLDHIPRLDLVVPAELAVAPTVDRVQEAVADVGMEAVREVLRGRVRRDQIAVGSTSPRSFPSPFAPPGNTGVTPSTSNSAVSRAAWTPVAPNSSRKSRICSKPSS